MAKPRTTAKASLISLDPQNHVVISTDGTKAAQGAKLLENHISWGDGTTEGGNGGPSSRLNHDYQKSNREIDYSFSLTVKDNKGKVATDMIIVRVPPSGAPATPPSLTLLTPSTGSIGTPIVVTGNNFGATQGTSKIYFNGTLATPSSWSNTSISVPVPSGATTGQVVVVVNNQSSNGLAFTVSGSVVDLGGYRPQMPVEYGMNLKGGRGDGVTTPMIIRVNTLNPNTAITSVGDGTFQGGYASALLASGPRYVLLENSGVITLSSGIHVNNPYLTVAGQCAPSPGVNIGGGVAGGVAQVEINTHDVIFQHHRFRPASLNDISALIGWTGSVKVVFDHMSAAWAEDENLAFVGTDCCAWRCLNYQSLYQPPGGNGSGGHGLLLYDNSVRLAAIGCLHCHCGRNPDVKGGITAFVGDFLSYDPCGPAINNNPSSSLWYQDNGLPSLCTYVNYRSVQGLDTANGSQGIRIGFGIAGTQIYISDQTVVGNMVDFFFAGADPRVGSPPVPIPTGWTSVGSSNLQSFLIANAGARPNDRDSVDSQAISDLINGTGHWAQTPGTYPVLANNHQTFSVPADPFGGVDSFGRNNLERALEVAALAWET